MSEATQEKRPPRGLAWAMELLHEERMAFAAKRSGGGYSVDLKRGNSSTNMGVIAIDLHGEQRDDQTSAEFLKEQRELFDTLCAAYPMPDGYVRAK